MCSNVLPGAFMSTLNELTEETAGYTRSDIRVKNTKDWYKEKMKMEKSF